MVRYRLLPWVFVLISSLSIAQGHGGGSGGGGRGGSSSAGTSITNPNANGTASTPNSYANLPTADMEGKIEFRTESILIQVPVVVTDKSGSHMKGLTKDDFHIFENGKEQKVSAFEEVVAANAQLPPVTPKPGEFQNLTLPTDQPRSVTVIALDSVNTPFLDQTYGRRELVRYLANNIESGQVMALMLMTSRGLKVVQGLTGDPEQLAQILKKASGELPALHDIGEGAQISAANDDVDAALFTNFIVKDANAAMQEFVERGDAFYAQFQQENAIETTLNSFMGIADALSGIPGRKSLIWATGGFPFEISTPATVPGGYLSTLYERTMQALADAQISVYPVDVRGLVTNTVVSSGQSALNSPQRGLSRRSWFLQSEIDTLNEFAEMTGGKAYYNTNDLASSFKRAADDASSYYLLGYYLDANNNNKSGWRQLKVKVSKSDTEIRARQGFFLTNATVHRDVTREAEIGNALASPLEGTGIPITMKWVGVSGEGNKKSAEFVVQLAPGGITLGGAPDNRVNFEFAVTAYAENAKKGDVPKKFGQTFAASVTEAKMAKFRADGIRFGGSVPDVAPGHYEVRLVVRDNVSGKIGSVTAPLTVN